MQYRATAYENTLKIQSYLLHLRSVLNFLLDWNSELTMGFSTLFSWKMTQNNQGKKSERVAVTVNKTVDLPNDL